MRSISFIHFSVSGLVAICVIGFSVLRRWMEESISLQAKICNETAAVVVVVNLFENFGIPIDGIDYQFRQWGGRGSRISNLGPSTAKWGRQSIIWPIFFWKLDPHEKEHNLSEGHASPAAPKKSISIETTWNNSPE